MRKTILKIKRLMQSKKAVSPVIAVILLIAIAVAASVTVFAYTQGILSGLSQASLVISNADATNQAVDVNEGDGVPDHLLTFTIQNSGGQQATINYLEVVDTDGDDWFSDMTGNTGNIVIYNLQTGELIKAQTDATFSLEIDAGQSVQLKCYLDGDPGGGSNDINAPITITLNTAAGDTVTASFNVP